MFALRLLLRQRLLLRLPWGAAGGALCCHGIRRVLRRHLVQRDVSLLRVHQLVWGQLQSQHVEHVRPQGAARQGAPRLQQQRIQGFAHEAEHGAQQQAAGAQAAGVGEDGAAVADLAARPEKRHAGAKLRHGSRRQRAQQRASGLQLRVLGGGGSGRQAGRAVDVLLGAVCQHGSHVPVPAAAAGCDKESTEHLPTRILAWLPD